MKNIIRKLKNKKIRGNVSLLVILILLASSVISLLSINQIQHLISYWNMTFNYFRAFYIAKAWNELGLTEVYHREAWFDHIVSSWDLIVTGNLVWIYTWFDPYFNMTISWNFKYLTNDVRYTNECNSGNKIVLGSWEWIMLALFTDITKPIDGILSDTSNIQPINYRDKIKIYDKIREWWGSDNYFTFWIFDYTDEYNMNNIFVETWTDIEYFIGKHQSNFWDNKRTYLTIKNSWEWSVSFCLYKYDELIPSYDSLITVQANYWDMEVWLQSVVKRWVPSWALDLLWDSDSSS